MEQIIVELFSDELNRETMVCSNCGRVLNRRDIHERTVETMIGEITLRRPYFYCENCKKGGALVPTRPDEAKGKGRGRKKVRAKRAKWEGEWREEKGFRFYLVDGARIEHVLCWHQVQSSEELKECLRKVKEAGLIPERDVPVSYTHLTLPTTPYV